MAAEASGGGPPGPGPPGLVRAYLRGVLKDAADPEAAARRAALGAALESGLETRMPPGGRLRLRALLARGRRTRLHEMATAFLRGDDGDRDDDAEIRESRRFVAEWRRGSPSAELPRMRIDEYETTILATVFDHAFRPAWHGDTRRSVLDIVEVAAMDTAFAAPSSRARLSQLADAFGASPYELTPDRVARVCFGSWDTAPGVYGRVEDSGSYLIAYYLACEALLASGVNDTAEISKVFRALARGAAGIDEDPESFVRRYNGLFPPMSQTGGGVLTSVSKRVSKMRQGLADAREAASQKMSDIGDKLRLEVSDLKTRASRVRGRLFRGRHGDGGGDDSDLERFRSARDAHLDTVVLPQHLLFEFAAAICDHADAHPSDWASGGAPPDALSGARSRAFHTLRLHTPTPDEPGSDRSETNELHQCACGILNPFRGLSLCPDEYRGLESQMLREWPQYGSAAGQYEPVPDQVRAIAHRRRRWQFVWMCSWAGLGEQDRAVVRRGLALVLQPGARAEMWPMRVVEVGGDSGEAELDPRGKVLLTRSEADSGAVVPRIRSMVSGNPYSARIVCLDTGAATVFEHEGGRLKELRL